jgi:glycosyltransferase involved in cell wall biosynthesis
MIPRKKILILFYRFPYPPYGGDTYKGFNMVTELSKYHDVTLFSLSNQNVPNEHIEIVEKIVKKVVVFKIHKFYSLLLALRFIFNKKPIQSNYFFTNKAQSLINLLLQEVDAVIPITIRMFQYVKESNKPILFDAVDSISLNYKKSIEKVTNFFWKLIYMIEESRVYDAELAAVKKSLFTFFVNHEEAKYWLNYGETYTLPNGVHPELFTSNEVTKNNDDSIVFFGKMDYQPNLDALSFLVDKVLPLLHSKIQIKVVGLDPNYLCEKKYKQNERVQVLGFLENPYLEIGKSFAAVLPMQTGGGIQNKILQCMALGQIVVTSDLGAKPIQNAKDQQHILIANQAQEYAQIINEIFLNAKAYAKIGQQAQALILQEYSWAFYGEKLNALIMQKVKND